jgi:putative ABC transport system ATP-binding protein
VPDVSNLAVRDLVVEFVHDGYCVRPLDGLSFDGKEGELVVLLGPSGCGKTTLLSCLGGILTPTSGSIMLGDSEATALRGRQLDDYRRHQIGFVFQAFNLIPSLTARENVAMPMILTGRARSEAYARADELLAVMGMSDRANHKPAKLSGGQQQRVALARGLGHRPPLLLADEPTANLDHIQAEAIIRLLRTIRSEGHLVVVSTHDARLVPIADRIVQMVPDLDDVLRARTTRTLAAGESLFEQGDASDVVYIIDEGEIDIVRILADKSEQPLARLGPGQYCGELGPLMGFPRSASARAATDVVLTVLSPHEFRERMLHR